MWGLRLPARRRHVWPNSDKFIKEQFAEVSPEVTKMITRAPTRVSSTRLINQTDQRSPFDTMVLEGEDLTSTARGDHAPFFASAADQKKATIAALGPDGRRRGADSFLSVVCA